MRNAYFDCLSPRHLRDIRSAWRFGIYYCLASETEFGKNYRVQSNNHLTYAQAAAAKAAAQKKEAAQKV